jgi:ribosomal protein S17E
MKKHERLPPRFKAQTIKDVFFHLEKSYSQLEIGSLSEQVMSIETTIQGLMHKALLDYFAFSFRTFVNLPDNFFRVKNQMYQIRYGQRVDKPVLEVWILPKEYSASNFLEAEVQLDSGGYFTQVFVAANSTLKSHFSRICELIQLIFETSYQWLTELLLKKLSELQMGGSIALYNYIRVVFKAESKAFFANKIWLGVFTEDKGYYLLDKDTSKHVLELLNRREYRSTKSPIYHLLHLTGLIMPYEKSVSRHAIQENKPIDFPLRKVAYISDDLDLLKTEEQMVQGGMYSLYPISVSKKLRLVAGYPTRYKSEILPILEKHQNEISSIYEAQLRNIEKYINLLSKNFARINWSQIGDFVGGLIGGFTKSLSQP